MASNFVSKAFREPIGRARNYGLNQMDRFLSLKTWMSTISHSVGSVEDGSRLQGGTCRFSLRHQRARYVNHGMKLRRDSKMVSRFLT